MEDDMIRSHAASRKKEIKAAGLSAYHNINNPNLKQIPDRLVATLKEGNPKG